MRSRYPLALVLCFTMTAPAIAEQTWGMVAYVTGRAVLIRPSEPVPVAVKRRARVFPGDRIETELGVQLQVMLFGRSALRVDDAVSKRQRSYAPFAGPSAWN